MTIINGDDDSYDTINKAWSKIWRNEDGKRHRDGDLPAVVWPDGTVVYYKDGKKHRDGDHPAMIWADGEVCYYKDGKIHRDGDHPAVIWANGDVEYWIDGVQQK